MTAEEYCSSRLFFTPKIRPLGGEAIPISIIRQRTPGMPGLSQGHYSTTFLPAPQFRGGVGRACDVRPLVPTAVAEEALMKHLLHKTREFPCSLPRLKGRELPNQYVRNKLLAILMCCLALVSASSQALAQVQTYSCPTAFGPVVAVPVLPATLMQSLRTVPNPVLPNGPLGVTRLDLTDYIANPQTAIQLGKAFFGRCRQAVTTRRPAPPATSRPAPIRGPGTR